MQKAFVLVTVSMTLWHYKVYYASKLIYVYMKFISILGKIQISLKFSTLILCIYLFFSRQFPPIFFLLFWGLISGNLKKKGDKIML